MKLSEVVAHLAVGLRVPLSDFVELTRAIAANADELAGDHPKAMRAAGLKGVKLRGRRGPGGSIEVDANVLSFLLTAHLCDGPRRTVTTTALGIATAVYRSSKHTKCQLTQQGVFGPAFVVLLSKRELFDRARLVRVSSDAGCAVIEFDGSESWFWKQGYGGLEKPWFRERVLVVKSAGFLFDLVNERELSPV